MSCCFADSPVTGGYGSTTSSLIYERVIAVDEDQAELAANAYRRFGKGRHPARLNYGDCFSYALAMQHAEPLLFKGNDFSQTDVLIAAY